MFLQKKFLCKISLFLILFGLTNTSVQAYEEVIIDPVIDKKSWDIGFVGIVDDDGDLFLPFSDYTDFLNVYVQNKKSKDEISGYFLNEQNTFKFNLNDLSDKEKQIIDNTTYISAKYLDNLFDTKTDFDYSRMIINIESEKELPPVTKLETEKRRQNIQKKTETLNFDSYEFDDRLFGPPVFDFSYGFGYSDGPGKSGSTSQSHFIDVSALLFGLDARLSAFSSDGFNFNEEELRFVMSRTFLGDKPNWLGISQIQMGDIYGINNNLLSSGKSGRGLSVSSFKDLVVSSDKTIQLTGALSAGWEVELFQGTQLIGFRNSGDSGIYEFNDVPVHYGLNEFKLVFYGPYGEKHEEIRRYYSGTSPVKVGELGYMMAAYQPNKLLFETPASKRGNNDDSDDDPVFDSTFYYGLTDFITLMGGYTTSGESSSSSKRSNLAEIGAQILLSGLSLQYNTLMDLTNSEFGHYANAQGNIYIGDLFLKYIYYGKVKASSSGSGGSYTKDEFEARLSGIFEFLKLPYYVSYQQTKNWNDDLSYSINGRLSKQILSRLNLTVENAYQNQQSSKTDTMSFMGQTYFGDFNLYAQANYEAYPDNFLSNLNANIDYRLDRYTYLRGRWQHSFGQNGAEDNDTFGLSTAFLTGIGGLSLDFQMDKHANYSITGTYNISIGTIPGELDLFSTDRGKITNKAAIYARVRDESDNPVPNVGISISGMETLKTDKYGNLLIGDVDAYQRKHIFYDIKSVDDFSLESDGEEEKRLVLRPGTVKPVDIKLAHKGTIEGKVNNDIWKTMDMIVEVKCPTLKEKLYNDLDSEGYFLIDHVPFGKCDFYLEDLDDKVYAILKDVEIHDVIQSVVITDLLEGIEVPETEKSDTASEEKKTKDTKSEETEQKSETTEEKTETQTDNNENTKEKTETDNSNENKTEKTDEKPRENESVSEPKPIETPSLSDTVNTAREAGLESAEKITETITETTSSAPAPIVPVIVPESNKTETVETKTEEKVSTETAEVKETVKTKEIETIKQETQQITKKKANYANPNSAKTKRYLNRQPVEYNPAPRATTKRTLRFAPRNRNVSSTQYYGDYYY